MGADETMTRRKYLILAGLGAGLLLAGLALWHWSPLLFGPPAGPGRVLVSGNIEAHESVLSFTQVTAPIVFLPFDEGAAVSAHTVLSRVDDRIYRQQVEIDRADVQTAAAQLAVNQSNLAAAQSNVASDRFDLAEKQLDYQRAEDLVAARSALPPGCSGSPRAAPPRSRCRPATWRARRPSNPPPISTTTWR
jgi:HlyD family secretion protein